MARGDGPSSRPAGSSAGGVLIAAYGVAAYVMFLVVFLYLIGFVADADFMVGNVHVVGKSIDRGGIGDGSLPSLRWSSTRRCSRCSPSSTASWPGPPSSAGGPASCRPAPSGPPTSWPSSVCLVVLVAAWHPITDDVWRVSAQPWRALLTALGLVGWAIVLLSTFLIDHFDLFGLRQVFARLRGRRACRAQVRDAASLPGGSAPDLLGFSDRVLGHTENDVGALAFCGRDDRIHPVRCPLGGA